MTWFWGEGGESGLQLTRKVAEQGGGESLILKWREAGGLGSEVERDREGGLDYKVGRERRFLNLK